MKAKIPVELTCSGKPQMRTATDEVSASGCYIETMFTMDIGTKLRLVFSLNEEKIAADGIVVTKYPQVGNGIYFIYMNPDHRSKLSKYIEECEKQAAEQ